MNRTRTDDALAAAEQAHAGDPERAELLARARRFKSSWLDLAEALSEVRQKSHWKRWGYDSFEAYGKSELHLRQETIDKLTGSFLFLKKSAPEVLRRDGVATPIPSYQSVDFLRRAEEKAPPEETLREIRHKVLDEAAPLAGLSRKYREVVFPIGDDERRDKGAATLRAAARRLRELLEGDSPASRRIVGELKSVLDRLLESLDEKSEAA